MTSKLRVAKASELVDSLGQLCDSSSGIADGKLASLDSTYAEQSKVNPVNLGLALVLFLASELIGRGLFYSLHMTSGL
ncbi:hypothetical protein O9992_01775 [Vibrio lentus]|nr:hypothetical protein [Vibrio lentus]